MLTPSLCSGPDTISDSAQKVIENSDVPAIEADGSEDTQPESDSEDEFFPADTDATSVKLEEAGTTSP